MHDALVKPMPGSTPCLAEPWTMSRSPVSRCAVLSAKVRVDPHLQCPIVLFWITNYDRAKLASIPPAQGLRIEGNGFRQLGDVITIEPPQDIASSLSEIGANRR